LFTGFIFSSECRGELVSKARLFLFHGAIHFPYQHMVDIKIDRWCGTGRVWLARLGESLETGVPINKSEY